MEIGDILSALRLGELMFEEELTWQAATAFMILFVLFGSIALGVFAMALDKLVESIENVMFMVRKFRTKP